MEKESISGKLIFIENTRQIEHLTNNLALINHKNGCSIFNLTTKKEIKIISKNYVSHLAVHPHKTKFALAHDKTIKIYDTKTEKQIWTTTASSPIASSLFSPLDPIIVIQYSIKSFRPSTCHNYEKNNDIFLPENNNNPYIAPIIAFHPIKQLLCKAYNYSTLLIYCQNSRTLKNTYESTAFNLFCTYSPNGEYILCGHFDNILILHLNSHLQKKIPYDKQNYVKEIQFHPSSLIIVTLSQPGDIIQYWNTKTTELLHEIKLKFSQDNYITYGNYNLLSFSPGGTKLLVALQNKCIILPVPFDVVNNKIMQPGTKEKAILTHWLLKNYILHEQNKIPQDIIQLLLYNLLKVSQQ